MYRDCRLQEFSAAECEGFAVGLDRASSVGGVSALALAWPTAVHR